MNQPILDSSTLRKYITPLLRPKILKTKREYLGRPLYKIRMKQVVRTLHPDIPSTTLWLYNGTQQPLQFEVVRGEDIYVCWSNCLPTIHLLQSQIDHTLPCSGTNIPDVRNVVHLHGGEQTPFSDGGPLEWYTPGHSRLFHYPNQQFPTMLFAHDHAIGITRLNNYAGLTGIVYMIRQPNIEEELHLPSGEFEVPLVITDKTVYTNGQLAYSMMPSDPPVHPLWSSHFLGNMILVNNVVWPYLDVQRCKYRFRIVNASDTRTYSLKLVTSQGLSVPPPFFQIGSDGGYLPQVIVLNDPIVANSPELLLGIAERADIITLI